MAPSAPKKSTVAKGPRPSPGGRSHPSGASARPVRRGSTGLAEKLRGPRSVGYFLVFMGVALIIQGLHVLEHVAQSLQVFVFGVPRAQAGGLLGAWFDFPIVHFTYNFAYFLFLLWAVAWAYGLGGFQRLDRLGMWCMLLAAGIQTYHAAEHVIQISQEVAVGTQRPAGFIGLFADNILVHLLLNTVVWVLPLISFWRFGGVGVMKQWLLTREVRLPASA